MLLIILFLNDTTTFGFFYGLLHRVCDLISISKEIAREEVAFAKDPESMDKKELEKLIASVEKQMRKAAADLDFETAAMLRDQMVELKKNLNEITGGK